MFGIVEKGAQERQQIALVRLGIDVLGFPALLQFRRARAAVTGAAGERNSQPAAKPEPH